jgi:CBS domain-containing membrane protein
MNSHHLQANDFVLALREMETYIDISVDDLVILNQKAEKYARLRGRESQLVEKLMSQPVKTVRPDSTLSAAAHILVTSKISGLAVVADDNKLVGIITEADFLRSLGVPSHHPDQSVWATLENMFHHQLQIGEPEGIVADLMNKKVVTITPQHSLHEVLDVMKQNRIKRVIVCDQDQHAVGMITRSDLVRIFFDNFNKVEAV